MPRSSLNAAKIYQLQSFSRKPKSDNVEKILEYIGIRTEGAIKEVQISRDDQQP